MNNISLIGNICTNLECETVGNNKTTILRFTVAVPRDYTNKDGERETDFIRCNAFGSTADFIEKYFEKGRRIGIVGSLRVDTVEDEEGERKYYTSVSISSASFCEKIVNGDEDKPKYKSKKK